LEGNTRPPEESSCTFGHSGFSCPNSQVLGFACAPAVFPKGVLARALKGLVLKDWLGCPRPRCARQGKTGAVRRATFP
jgi:hypothetical protein